MPSTDRPRTPAGWLALLAVSTTLAGCLGPAADPRGADGAAGARVPLAVPSVDFEHDHADPALHPRHSLGIRELASLVYEEGAFSRAITVGPARFDLGTGGRLVLAGDLLFVTLSRRAPDGPVPVALVPEAARFEAGFAVVDVSDPRRPTLLGAYHSEWGGNEGEGLGVTPDGKYAFVVIETAFSSPPVPPAVEIVDVSDPAAPVLARRIPWPDTPHIATAFERDGEEYVALSEYNPDNLAAYVADRGGEKTNRLALWRFDRERLLLEPAARYDSSLMDKAPEPYFPHDHAVLTHPVTGQRLLYVGAFGGGGRILSLEGALSATDTLDEVGYTLEAGEAPVVRHHSFNPAPAARDGLLATAAVPRSRNHDGPGSAYLSIYDTFDPATPQLLGQWRHPDTDFLPEDLPGLNLHAPHFSADATRLFVPHYHAGLFVFDVSTRAAIETLEPVAFWSPDGVDAQPGAPYVTSVIEAVEVDGVVLATDRQAGRLYVLELVD